MRHTRRNPMHHTRRNPSHNASHGVWMVLSETSLAEVVFELAICILTQQHEPLVEPIVRQRSALGVISGSLGGASVLSHTRF